MANFCDGIVQNIERTECIGNSLEKINSNFAGLETAGCDLENDVNALKVFNTVNTPTVTLGWNSSTRTLSAAATISTNSTSLSSSPMVAKAWVNFNGTGTIAIRSSYNISSITDLGVGRYRVNTSFTTANKPIVSTCKQNQLRTSGRPFDANVLLFNVDYNGTVLPATSFGLSVTGDPGGSGTTYVDAFDVNAVIFSN